MRTPSLHGTLRLRTPSLRVDELEALPVQRVPDATAASKLVKGDDHDGLDGIRSRCTSGYSNNGHGHLSPGRREEPPQPTPPLRRGQPGAEATPATPRQTSGSDDVDHAVRDMPESAEGQFRRGVGKLGGRHRDKEFVVRNSTLTDLMAVSHVRTVYHIAVVVFIILLLRTVPQDLATHGTVTLGLGMVRYSFGSFHLVIGLWTGMMLAALAQYAAFVHWARRRPRLAAAARRCWDGAHLAALVLFDAALVLLPALAVACNGLPFASSMAVLCELLRILMKTHAFVRSNVPRALEEGTIPTFAQYLYFMFAPTLIYRDSYPRTPKIRWRFVGVCVLETLGCVLFISILVERCVLPLFKDFGLRPGRPGSVTALGLAEDVVASALPGGLIHACCFYLLLHAFHNAAAEVLRFGDRMFYSDWWNQDNFPSYYLKWNVLVQDWLHEFVYRDVVLLGGTRLMAKLTVFTISAVVHEFVLGLSVGFFYPILYLHFGVIGMLLSFVTVKASSSSMGNLFLWFSIILGNGFLYGFYCIEYYARWNCAKTIDSMWDLFVPRSWSCIPKKTS